MDGRPGPPSSSTEPAWEGASPRQGPGAHCLQSPQVEGIGGPKSRSSKPFLPGTSAGFGLEFELPPSCDRRKKRLPRLCSELPRSLLLSQPLPKQNETKPKNVWGEGRGIQGTLEGPGKVAFSGA